jgi:acetoin utilization protein AcuB
MIVRDWMQADPVIIGSEMLVCEAHRVLSENRLHALPVVDGGRLRGLVTRANLLRMAHFVQRTQSSDEFDFFVRRLKVRDVMVRRPATVQASDTMQACLLKGQALGVAQFPVLDGEQVVGVISANEIFQLAAHLLAA